MKKILLYTDTPIVGGAELQMLLLGKFLDKEKFQPILACSNFPQLDKWCENFEKEGIQVIRLKVKHKHDPSHYFQLKKIIKEEKIDLLHAHIWNPASCRYAFAAAKSTKIPVITTEHDPFKISFIKDIFKKNSLKQVKKIITVSKNNKKILSELYPNFAEKISLIHNGIDTTWWHSQLLRFTENDYREIKEKTFHARTNTLILLAVAQLHERKGLKYLIEAISQVKENFPNIKLVIIGEGPERNKLEAQIKDLKIENHVTMLGAKKKIAHYLESADIFVLPSVREAFGLVLLEAMMIPLPIIASKTGGIPEIIENEKNGILVKAEDSEALKNAIIDLISNEEKRHELAKNGHETVTKNFRAEKMAEEYEKAYQEILS